MTGLPSSKIVIDLPPGGLESLPPREVIRFCAAALGDISKILSNHIIERDGVLHIEKSEAKLVKKYIDHAIHWASI